MTATVVSRINRRICAIISTVSNACLIDGPLFPDKAMILFKPNSKFAPRPATNIVNPETNNKIVFSQHLKEGLKRITTPNGGVFW
jgi:hypothetical protein